MATKHPMDAWGKVYVRKPGTGHIESASDDMSQYELLEGVHFSKIQLDFTVDRGTRNPYYGKRFSIGSLGHRIKMPFPLGMYQEMDLNRSEFAFERYIAAMKDIGLLDNKTEEQLEKMKAYLFDTRFHLIGLISSRDNADDEQVDYMEIFLAYTMVDDLFESLQEKLSKAGKGKAAEATKLSYKYTVRLAHVIAVALEAEGEEQAAAFVRLNERVAQGKSIVDGVENPSPIEKNLVRGMDAIRIVTLKVAKQYNIPSYPFFAKYAEYILFELMESSTEWSEEVMGGENAAMMLSTILRIRRISAGGGLMFEGVTIHCGNTVDPEIRKSALYQHIYMLAENFCGRMQDYYSVKKELVGKGEEWRNNQGGLLVKLCGFTEHDALGEIAKIANEMVEQLYVLEPILLNTWEGEKRKQVENFLWDLNKTVTLFGYACATTNRYHRDMVLDCYIEN